MSLLLDITFYITHTVLILYIIHSALAAFFKSKQNYESTIIIYMIYIFTSVTSHFLRITPWMNVTLNIILVYMLSISFISNFKKRITIACCWAIFTMITETLVSILYVSMLEQRLTVVILNDTTNLLVTIIHTLILLVIMKSIGIYAQKKTLSEALTIFDSLYVSIIPVCSIFILYFFVQMSCLYNVNHSIVMMSCILIVFINVFFFALFDKIRISDQLKYENALLKNQAEYFSKLEENANDTFEKVRTIKHDLKHQLLYLKAKADEESNTSLEEVRNLLSEIIQNVSLDKQIAYTKNKSLNRLLNYKLLTTKESYIDFDIKISIRDDTYIDEVSLYTILGNAIDNAIRNFDCSHSDMNKIAIRVIDDYDNLFISISNPYNKKLKFKNGLPITDKPDKTLHGIGLQSIKNLVESKDGYMKVTSDNHVFHLEILLYEEIQRKNSGQDK